MKPSFDEYTQEYYYNRRYYDANDPEQVKILEKEIDAYDEYLAEYADHIYKRRKDEGV